MGIGGCKESAEWTPVSFPNIGHCPVGSQGRRSPGDDDPTGYLVECSTYPFEHRSSGDLYEGFV